MVEKAELGIEMLVPHVVIRDADGNITDEFDCEKKMGTPPSTPTSAPPTPVSDPPPEEAPHEQTFRAAQVPVTYLEGGAGVWAEIIQFGQVVRVQVCNMELSQEAARQWKRALNKLHDL